MTKHASDVTQAAEQSQPMLALFEQALPVAPDIHEELVDSKERELHAERQAFLMDKTGFYASDSSELSLAVRLIEESERKPGFGVRAYFGSILQRQSNAKKVKTDDPQAVLRRLTRNIIGYTKNSRIDSGFLGFLRQDLASTEIPTTSLSSIDVIAMRVEGDSITRAIVDLLRYVDTVELAEGKGTDHTNDKYFSEDPAAKARIDKFVKSLTVAETRDLIDLRQPQYQPRAEFWTGILEQLTYHNSVKAIAKEALDGFALATQESQPR